MFEYISNERSSWFGPFIAQQCLAAIGPLVILIGIIWLFDTYGQSGVLNNALIYVVMASLSFPLGYCVGRMLPRLIPTGKWVWVLPVCLLLIAAYDELTINANRAYGYQHAFLKTMEEFFYPHTLTGDVAMTFSTIPAWSSVCYAVGVMTAAKYRSRSKQRPLDLP